MTIIEHGNTYRTIRCPFCHCLFGYKSSETYIQHFSPIYTTAKKIIGSINVDCPECAKSIAIEELID